MINSIVVFLLMALSLLNYSSAFGNKISTDLKLNKDCSDQELFCMAYSKSFENGSGIFLTGADDSEKLTQAKNLIVNGAQGYPKEVKYERTGSNTVKITAEYVTNKSIKDDPQATKELLRMLGNPRVVVNISEINLGQDVLRSHAESSIENILIDAGYRVLNFPQDYLKKLEERKKSLEIRTTEKSEVSVSGPLSNVNYEGHGREYILDYSSLIIGRGNDSEALEVAKQIDADIILVGGAYTEPIELPPAANAWKVQGYKKAKSYLNIQAMIVSSSELVYSNSVTSDALELGESMAGQKALMEVGVATGKELVYKLLENVKARGLNFN